jgi:hypothetical protein
MVVECRMVAYPRLVAVPPTMSTAADKLIPVHAPVVVTVVAVAALALFHPDSPTRLSAVVAEP